MTEEARSAQFARPTVATRSAPLPGRRVEWTAFLYILPAFLVLGVFHILPVFYAIYISLNTGAINKFVFVGLANYARALGGGEFWSSLGLTVVYALMTMPFTIALGLFFAYLLYQGVRGTGIYRTIFFLPYVISTVASSIVWAWVFDPASGLANILLQRVGIEPLRWLIEPSGVIELLGERMGFAVPAWAHGPSLALVAIAIFSIWQSTGFDIVIFLAGLTNIPRELYEAARIDGANGFELFRYITIPLLAPTTFFVVVISVINSFQAFNHIYAMNLAAAQKLGGPLGSTATMTVFMFDQLYSFSNYGYASTIAVLLSLFILILTLINFRFLGGRVQY